ncbi:hypothetical protein, partial [Enterobacter hormaechei]
MRTLTPELNPGDYV